MLPRSAVAGFMVAAALTAGTPLVRADISFINTFTDSAGTGFYDPILGPERQSAFVAAESIWSSLLVSSYPDETIAVSASFAAEGGTMTSAVIGSTNPTFYPPGFSSSNPKYRPLTLYASALANHLAGTALDTGGLPQMSVVFNSTIDSGTVLDGQTFYYGTDGADGANQLDFETLALHELCHGLGFISSIAQDGSFPNTFGVPTAFDRFLYRGSTGSYLANDLVFQAESDGQRAADIVSGDLYFRGPATMLVDGPDGAPLFAPNPYEAGSSVSHIDPSLSDLMNPVYGGPDHTPSATDLAILSDMGWDVVMPVPEPGSLTLLGVGVVLLARRGVWRASEWRRIATF